MALWNCKLLLLLALLCPSLQYYQDDYYYYSYDSTISDLKTVKVVIGIVGGAIVLICLLVTLIVCLCKHCNGVNQQFADLQNMYAQRVSTNLAFNFETSRLQLQQMFEGICQKTSSFRLLHNQQWTDVSFSQVRLTPIGESILQIEAKGTNFLGQWTGRGQLIMTTSGPFFWLAKSITSFNGQPPNQPNALMVHESSLIADNAMHGQWFFRNQQAQPDRRGEWSIRPVHSDQLVPMPDQGMPSADRFLG